MTSNKVINFPPFRFDIENQLLCRGSESLPLRAKTSAVLRYLLEHPGQLITKNELLDAVWPETSVSDAVLKVSIRELREALNDDPKQPRFIETAHRSGYRCIAEIKTSNTPPQLTSFIGREPEVAEIKRRLSGTRLLTLTGAGGSGKTRLAVRVVDDLSDESGDEVWWVELSPLTDGSLVPQTVASALGVREQSGKALVQVLCDSIRQRRVTLVFDNCEHLISACAQLIAVLLPRCPDLKILATSREILGVAGEVVFPVPQLSLPQQDTETSASEAMSFEGICLFVERAAATGSDFSLTNENVATVAHLCRRLDGIPLAIELAATRIRSLTIEQLAERMEDCLSLLAASGRRDRQRHQTLRATIEWSYRLLDHGEAAMLRRISVFAGGWTLDAAEEICVVEQALIGGNVIDLLPRLVDKSLVIATHVRRAARFRLLETIRQYAAEKLLETGELTELRQRHAAFFLRWAEKLAPSLVTPQREETMSQLDSESDNLRSALQFFAETGKKDEEMRLCQALFFYWFFRGQWTEGRRRLDEALAHSLDRGMTPLRAKTMSDTGMLASMMGDHQTSLALLEESREIHQQQGHAWPLANALVFLAYELATTDLPRARKLVEEGVAICRERDNKFFLAMALNHLGAIAFVQKDHETARAVYEEAVALGRELNDNWALASSLRGLGGVALRLKDHELAATHLKESLASLRNTKEKWFTSRTFDTLAEMYSSQKDYERAARLFGAAATTRETVGASLFAFYREEYENHFDTARNALGQDRFDSLWSEGRAMTLEQAARYVLDD